METKKENKFYKSYSKLSEIKLVSIKLVQPSRITMWADKVLPGGKIIGEVLNANTVHYKTFKPYKGGLFCQRIFGPLKDFECACNKPTKYKYKKQISNQMSDGHIEIRNELDIKFDKIIKKLNTNYSSKILYPLSGGDKVVSGHISAGFVPSSTPPINLGQTLKDGLTGTHLKINSFKNTRKYCNTCQVQYTWSIMRRYQLGYIKLVSPVTHVWYLKGFPSYLSILLDMKRKELKSVIYCVQSTTLENILKPKPSLSNPSEIISSWKKIQEKIINQNQNNTLPIPGSPPWGGPPTVGKEHKGFKGSQARVEVETLFNRINSTPHRDDTAIHPANGSPSGSGLYPDRGVVAPPRRSGELSDLAKKKIEKRKKLQINKHKYLPGTFNSLNNEVKNSTVNLGQKAKDGFTTFVNSFLYGHPTGESPVAGQRPSPNAQNKNVNKININDFKKGFIFTKDKDKDIEQNFNNYSNFRVKPDLKQLKNYFSLTDKINLKRLKILSLLIIQSKNQVLPRKEWEGDQSKTGLPPKTSGKMVRPEMKKILKKMNIPYYILLNININNSCDSHIYNNFINIMWRKFMKTSLKNSLIRLNNIFGRCPKTKLNLFFESLIKTDSYLAPPRGGASIFAGWNSLPSRDINESPLLLGDDKEQKFLGLIIKSFNKLFSRTANDYFKFKYGRTATDLSKYSFIEEFYIKSHFNLELYTLSNFSTKINQFLIADFLSDLFLPGTPLMPLTPALIPPYLNLNMVETPSRGVAQDGIKEVRGYGQEPDLVAQPGAVLHGAPSKLNKYNSILKNLTKIFFKVFLQNSTLMLAKINTEPHDYKLKINQNASISEDFKNKLLKILQRKEKIYNIKFTHNSILYNICFQKNRNRHRGAQLNGLTAPESKNNISVPRAGQQNYPFPIIMENNQISKKDLKILTNVFIDWLQRECVLMLDVYSNKYFGCASYTEKRAPSLNPYNKTDLIFKNKIDWYNNHYFMYYSDATYSYFKYYINGRTSKQGSPNTVLGALPVKIKIGVHKGEWLTGQWAAEKDGGLHQKDKSLFKPGIPPQWVSSEVMCTGEHFWDGTTQYGKIKKTLDSLILYPKRKFKRTTSDRWTIYLKRELGAIDINVHGRTAKREFDIFKPTISQYCQKIEQFEKE